MGRNGMKKWMIVLLFALVISNAYSMQRTELVENKKQLGTIQYDGHLFSTNLVEVQTPANATLVKSHVHLGDKVKQNQLLFEFVSPELELQLKDANMAVLESQDALRKLKTWSKSYEAMQAMANFEKAKHENLRIQSRLSQTKELYRKGIIAKEECLNDERLYKDSEQYVENAKRQLVEIKEKANPTALNLATLQLEQAESKKALLQQKVEQLKIRSPIEGTLLAPKTNDSKQISPFYLYKVFNGQEVIAWVADLTKLCITIRVDEFDIVRLHKGQSAMITFMAFAENKLPAKIVGMAESHLSAKDSEVTTYDVKVALNEIPSHLQDKLLMGMSAKVVLEQTMPEGLWISKMAVQYENDEPYVEKMNGPKTIKQKVVLGDNAKNDVLVLGGLVAGDKVVVHG
jgi:HlyD family secretion protein